MSTKKPGLVQVGEGDPRVVTASDPLVITAVQATYPWVQIAPGGSVQVQVSSTVNFDKLEKLSGSTGKGA